MIDRANSYTSSNANAPRLLPQSNAVPSSLVRQSRARTCCLTTTASRTRTAATLALARLAASGSALLDSRRRSERAAFVVHCCDRAHQPNQTKPALLSVQDKGPSTAHTHPSERSCGGLRSVCVCVCFARLGEASDRACEQIRADNSRARACACMSLGSRPWWTREASKRPARNWAAGKRTGVERRGLERLRLQQCWRTGWLESEQQAGAGAGAGASRESALGQRRTCALYGFAAQRKSARSSLFRVPRSASFGARATQVTWRFARITTARGAKRGYTARAPVGGAAHASVRNEGSKGMHCACAVLLQRSRQAAAARDASAWRRSSRNERASWQGVLLDPKSDNLVFWADRADIEGVRSECSQTGRRRCDHAAGRNANRASDFERVARRHHLLPLLLLLPCHKKALVCSTVALGLRTRQRGPHEMLARADRLSECKGGRNGGRLAIDRSLLLRQGKQVLDRKCVCVCVCVCGAGIGSDDGDDE